MAEGLWITIIGGVLSTGVVILCIETLRRYRARRPYVRLLDFDQSEPVVIVFPARADEPDSTRPIRDRRVAFEDMLAANYIERLLSLSAWPVDAVQMREHKGFGKVDVQDQAKNLVLICSPRSNTITREFLAKINENTGLEWEFEQEGDEYPFIRTKDGKWQSASFAQERSLREAGKGAAEGPLDDLAVIIRAPNPYNPAAKVLIISGLRAIGTWGAGKYLRQNAAAICKRTQGGDFACLVRVTYHNWRIENVEPTDVFRLL